VGEKMAPAILTGHSHRRNEPVHSCHMVLSAALLRCRFMMSMSNAVYFEKVTIHSFGFWILNSFIEQNTTPSATKGLTFLFSKVC
jgi:hypothetical protein